ncbi:MAG: hypothetical protein C0607_03470 [Azoarcus sp.]|nr:MAG: hypothetical protein C0607_03470 [Azoarcus sp.]TVT55708.1 MAG: helix-turn-helix domain-containing protein [Azoarcus sp. PHD]
MKSSAKDRKLITELVINTKQYRRSLRESQAVFWGRLGVTQSGGSRYESGRDMPQSAAMLAALYALGYVSDDELREVRELLAPFYGTKTPKQEVPEIVRPRLRSSAVQRAARRPTPARERTAR